MYVAVSSEESLSSTIRASLWLVFLFGGRTVAMMIVGGEMEKNMRLQEVDMSFI